MLTCSERECLNSAISICFCESISCMCEYHLKDHLQRNINSKHNFKFFNNELYIEALQVIESIIELMIYSLESYNKQLFSAQSNSTNKLTNELSQSIEKNNLTLESFKNWHKLLQENKNENYALMQIISSSSDKSEATISFIKHLIMNSFKTELIYNNTYWRNQIKNSIESLIFEILIILDKIKLLIENWTNSQMIPFKISLHNPVHSRIHWDEINALKIDIQRIDEKYQKTISIYSSSMHMKTSEGLSLSFLTKVYKEFLNIKNLFCSLLDQKEIILNRFEKILNLYWRGGTCNIAIFSFDPKTKEIEFNSNSTGDICKEMPGSIGACASFIALPNSEIFCYGVHNIYESFIIDCNHNIRIIPNSHDCKYAGIVYFENNVFVFGGQTNWKSHRFARKYNLNTNRWGLLPKIPKPASSCACIVYDQKILFSGQEHRSLYQYDVKISNYSIIFNGLGKTNKVLFSSDSKVYIIEGNGGIFESRENEYKFDRIGNSSLCDGTGQNCWINMHGSIYFSKFHESYGLNYYCFNLKTKKIAFVTDLIWQVYFP